MHQLITAFATELRTHALPAAQTAATLLERLTDTECTGPTGNFTPRYLDEALAAAQTHPLTAQFAAIAPRVSWVEVSKRPMPASFAGRYSYCEIVGQDPTSVQAPDIRFGAYLQFPDTWYPRHWHAAEELYLPLSGTADWTRDGVTDRPAPPGTLIRHASYEHHATRTGPEPLLALWVWLGDLDFYRYGIEGV
ncbi:MAG TPA: dimethylsulfonioproprionate lyase family protein [Thermohalobaculum sp.]|nr:dimethylsulfonioproprionate lyase family protein [Thermohalobaculum sp.]